MRALVIAIGNRMRADDGVGHRVADLLEPAPGVVFLRLHQLAPEIASEMQDAELVLFLDADPAAEYPSLERIDGQVEGPSPLSHWTSPGALVSLSTQLYGFHGEAWLCHLPARDFTHSAEITPEAEAQTSVAARLVRELLEPRSTHPH